MTRTSSRSRPIGPSSRLGLFIFVVALAGSRRAFAWMPSPLAPSIPTSFSIRRSSSISMDTEGPMAPFAIPAPLLSGKKSKPVFFGQQPRMNLDTHTRSNRHEVSEKKDSRVFVPFWEWQLSYLQEHLSNFEIHPMPMNYIDNGKGNRMITICASSDEYRWIRMTYLDGGNQTQIFTSVCYPRGNLPILGSDFLQFGGQRQLAIVDFQPIHSEESGHDMVYEHLLKQIRDRFPSMQEPMTKKFFDPDQYFSKQTLIGKFQKGPDEMLEQNALPAYQAYTKLHLEMTKQHQGSAETSSLSAQQVVEKHADYESYISERDPAHPMFSSMFGSDVAEQFLYQVMFPLAARRQA